MDRILFGDNQFFAVNHRSEEKARAQAIRFQDTAAIIEVLDAAYDAGINVFMCTTHERVTEICDHVRANPQHYCRFGFYPCMPYAHKYANAVTEYGMIEALRRFLPQEDLIAALLKGSLSIATKDVEGIIRLLIDAEMKMFKDLKTPVILLQNVVTDLILGIGINDAFRIFADHTRERYGAEPGFITMNMPRLLDVLEKIGLQNPIICSNINKIGFRMCGGLELYERVLATRRFRPIAMSIFGSGALPPREAIEYVCRLKGIKSIVFGASSRTHILETKRLIDEYSGAACVNCES